MAPRLVDAHVFVSAGIQPNWHIAEAMRFLFLLDISYKS
jgi:hypothetical protein